MVKDIKKVTKIWDDEGEVANRVADNDLSQTHWVAGQNACGSSKTWAHWGETLNDGSASKILDFIRSRNNKEPHNHLFASLCWANRHTIMTVPHATAKANWSNGLKKSKTSAAGISLLYLPVK